MHRNVEIWKKRHERLMRMNETARQQLAHASASPHWGQKGKAVAAMWVAKFNRVESRVWHALCVAKGWRKA